MLFRFIAAAAFLLLFLMVIPIRVQMDIHHGQRRLMRVTLTAFGFERITLIESTQTPQGRQIEIRGRNGATRQLKTSASQRQLLRSIFRGLRQAPAARRFLLDHLHPLQLDAQWMLHAASAASTALLAGAVRTALSILPRRWLGVARVRVLPDFLREHQTLQMRCIFWLRPGTLFITTGLILFHQATQAIKREDHLWNTPSEN